jgi:hypothetical protein
MPIRGEDMVEKDRVIELFEEVIDLGYTPPGEREKSQDQVTRAMMDRIAQICVLLNPSDPRSLQQLACDVIEIALRARLDGHTFDIEALLASRLHPH